MIMARTRSPVRRFSFGIISLRRRRPSTRPRLDDDVALVQALDGADEDLLAARHEVVQQHLALGVADLLQDHLLGGHARRCGRSAPTRPLPRCSRRPRCRGSASMRFEQQDFLDRAAAGRPRPARRASGGRSRSRRCRGRPTTRMSTSPPCSFLVAWASAASTARKTTSRSTFFSREIASTSINISRFIGFDLRQPLRPHARRCRRVLGANLRPLKSTTGTSRASRTSSRVKLSTCSSPARARLALLAGPRPRAPAPTGSRRASWPRPCGRRRQHQRASRPRPPSARRGSACGP